jgi:hypothetical protein
MWGEHEGMGWWMVFGSVWMIVFWGLVIWAIVALVNRGGLSLPRFPGHLDCGEVIAQRGVPDGYEVSSRVP